MTSAPWWERGWLSIDLETTGTDPRTARIVELAALNIDAAGDLVTAGAGASITTLVTPPPDLTAEEWAGAEEVHGITLARARAEGRPLPAVILELGELLHRANRVRKPVVIYNARFDWTLLHAEAARTPHELPAAVPLLDPYVLDRHVEPYRKGKRKLALVAAAHGLEVDEAALHGAAADAHLSAGIMAALAHKSRRLRALTLAELVAHQAAYHEEWREGFNRFLATRTPPADWRVGPGWPMEVHTPTAEELAAQERPA